MNMMINIYLFYNVIVKMYLNYNIQYTLYLINFFYSTYFILALMNHSSPKSYGNCSNLSTVSQFSLGFIWIAGCNYSDENVLCRRFGSEITLSDLYTYSHWKQICKQTGNTNKNVYSFWYAFAWWTTTTMALKSAE